MDTKKKLLLFLYENRHSSYSLEINNIFKDCELRPIDIQSLIGDLKRNNLIETDSKYARLGCSVPSPFDRSRHYFYTTENVILKAKLVLTIGEQYVRDNYLAQNNIPIINANQVIYTVGDINAPISQDNVLLESLISQNIVARKYKKSTINRTVKSIIWIISGIVSLVAFYELIKPFISLFF